MKFLSIKNTSYSYDDEYDVVSNVNWTINKGEFHTLLGRSGCGKTTLLKIAAGLLKPSAGGIYIEGEQLQDPSERIGFVFQNPTLLEWLTVQDNILLPIKLKERPNSVYLEKVNSLLHLFGISKFGNRFPNELSGGQQSRVAIARSLITDPLILLMDEPFAALDAITREELQDDLLRICNLNETTVLFVTHDVREAVYLSDHLAIMEQGVISDRLDVNLVKPRQIKTRYNKMFNKICYDVKTIMINNFKRYGQ